MNDKKKTIIAIIATFVIAGLLGFYGGRFYERNAQQKRFTQMRGGFQQNGGNFRQGIRGQGVPGAPGGTGGRPTTQTTPSTGQ